MNNLQLLAKKATDNTVTEFIETLSDLTYQSAIYGELYLDTELLPIINLDKVLTLVAKSLIVGYVPLSSLMYKVAGLIDSPLKGQGIELTPSRLLQVSGELLVCIANGEGSLADVIVSSDEYSQPALIAMFTVTEQIREDCLKWENAPVHLYKPKPCNGRSDIDGESISTRGYVHANETVPTDVIDRLQSIPHKISPYGLSSMLIPSSKQRLNTAMFYRWADQWNNIARMLGDQPFYVGSKMQPQGRLGVTPKIVSLHGNSSAKPFIHSAEPEVLTAEGIKQLTLHTIECGSDFWGKMDDQDALLYWDTFQETLLDDLEEVPNALLDAYECLLQAERGEPVSIWCKADCPSSGLSLAILLMKCKTSAENMALMMPNRNCAYQELADECGLTRSEVKDVVTPVLFGSGVAFEDLDPASATALYNAMALKFPAIMDYGNVCKDAWDTRAEEYHVTDWTGQKRVLRVSNNRTKYIVIRNLDDLEVTVQYKEFGAIPYTSGKLMPFLAHVLDASIAAEMVRRAMYDEDAINNSKETLVTLNEMYGEPVEGVLLKPITYDNCVDVFSVDISNPAVRFGLGRVIDLMLSHKPYNTWTEFDDFAAGANNMYFSKLHYKEIIAGIADGEVLLDMMKSMSVILPSKIGKLTGKNIRENCQYPIV